MVIIDAMGVVVVTRVKLFINGMVIIGAIGVVVVTSVKFFINWDGCNRCNGCGCNKCDYYNGHY